MVRKEAGKTPERKKKESLVPLYRLHILDVVAELFFGSGPLFPFSSSWRNIIKILSMLFTST